MAGCVRCGRPGPVWPIQTSLAKRPRAARGFGLTTCCSWRRSSRTCARHRRREARMSSRLRRECQGIFAALRACLRRNCPLRPRLKLFYQDHGGWMRLDGVTSAVYFNFFFLKEYRTDAPLRCQNRAPQGPGSFAPSSRTGPCPRVSGGRLLRCPRPGAGQVRDGATGPPGEGHQSRSGRTVWLVPADLLSGRGGPGPCGVGGLAPAAARPEGRAQADAGGHGLHRRAPGGGRPAAGTPPGAPDRRAAGSIGASAQYRTGGRAPKKTVAAGAIRALPPTALATYETLRAAVLTDQARPEGLGALRFHGLLQGLRVLLAEPAVVPTEPTVNAADPRYLPHDPAFVHQLTNLLLTEEGHVY